VGEPVVIEAAVFADGQMKIAADLLYRREDETEWTRLPMEPQPGDRFRASFACKELTTYVFTIEAWINKFAKWQRDLAKKAWAAQDVSVDLEIGSQLVEDAAGRTSGTDARALRSAAALIAGGSPRSRRIQAALDPELAERMRALGDRRFAAPYHRELRIKVDPPKAQFSSWYEMFPRSASPEPGRPGTFKDVERRLPYVAAMGFDVLYLPPIHPIGDTHRKGPNNAETANPGDPGSPWAIGSLAGGHKAINPDLGTLPDFRRLIREAKRLGIDIALDIAFQCSPDHPYVNEHPEWFKTRPNGTVQYAENPPKKYQDIYPFDFETEAWESLWQELKGIFLFWMEQGVRIFRVDNPHTKPFAFWEWCISEIHKVDPGVILLSEAFTRPRIMYRLAKLGFSQSYTYFAWRNDKRSITRYFTEITRPPISDFFRPNAWPNTPDILTATLQGGERPAFIARLVLAATLSASYGIYGPPFELMEPVAREPGGEEYLDSEKYVVRHWDIERADNLSDMISRVNAARRDNPPLQSNARLRFHRIGNDKIIAYSKATEDNSNIILCVVNLDPVSAQSGRVQLPVKDWGISTTAPYDVKELLSGADYTWQGNTTFIQLDPATTPTQVFRLSGRAKVNERKAR
jgi:starch synthase (maltosyl-transferring)